MITKGSTSQKAANHRSCPSHPEDPVQVHSWELLHGILTLCWAGSVVCLWCSMKTWLGGDTWRFDGTGAACREEDTSTFARFAADCPSPLPALLPGGPLLAPSSALAAGSAPFLLPGAPASSFCMSSSSLLLSCSIRGRSLCIVKIGFPARLRHLLTRPAQDMHI